MAAGPVRKIVNIDEEKCDGCGVCIPSCAEGALQLIDGKARLVKDEYCDGLGNCIGECPRGAITIEEREAEPFDERVAAGNLPEQERGDGNHPGGFHPSAVSRIERDAGDDIDGSRLNQWPVQLMLVPANAPFLRNADVVLAAECVPFAYPDFNRDFLGDAALLVACPKLDDFASRQEKLTEILAESGLRSLTVVHMEVPCCSGLMHMVRQAILATRNTIPFREITIGINGDLKKA